MNWRDTIAQLRTFGPRFACLLTGMLLGGSLAWAHTPQIVPGTGLGSTVPFYNSQGISTVSNNLLFNGTAFTAGVWQATSIATTFTDAKVVSVSCTTITCSGTNPATFSVGTAAITPVKGGTGLDTSASSGVFSVNAGSWIVNNVLTTNRLLIAATGNTITSNANLTYDGTSFVVGTSGPHAIGGATVAGEVLRLYTTVTASGGAAIGLRLGSGTMTAAANGDTFALTSSIPTTIATGSSTGLTVTGYNLAGSHFSKTGTGTIDTAATIRIGDAPTIGTTNYAVWVTSGTTKLDGNNILKNMAAGTNAASIVGNSDALDIGDSATGDQLYATFYEPSFTNFGIRIRYSSTSGILKFNNLASGTEDNTTPMFQLERSGGGVSILKSGLRLGTPTGGDKGAGTINVATDIFKNNTAYTNPDYVLEHWATGQIVRHAGKEGAALYRGLHDLGVVERYARMTYSLPLMNQNREGGAFARGDLLMATVEEAYLYLFQHDHRLDTLEARIKTLEERK